MAKKSKYSDTLNPRTTDFDMRAGLLKKEPLLQKEWAEQDLYGQIRRARSGGPRFILHDGPPYANGAIHMGHALNKTLKDIVIRYKTMTGHDAPMVHGWDCHGQPIEQKIAEQLGERMERMSAEEIRTQCAEFARRFVGVQAEQFRRLGVLGEMSEPYRPYITMDPGYESAVLELFARLVEQELVFKQLKPVHWSIDNRTALAEAELEYQQREDTSVYVGFTVTGGEFARLPGVSEEGKLQLLIWTTTPWTLPANLAVAVHPDIEYATVHASTADGPALYVIATERVETVLGKVRAARPDWLGEWKVLKTYPGPTRAAPSCPPTTSRWKTGPGWSTPRRGTARRTTEPRCARGWRSTVPSAATGPSTRPPPSSSGARPSGRPTRWSSSTSSATASCCSPR